MTADYTTHEPEWETTEHGWHAVAALCSKGYQWTAYIEYVDAPSWRIWAGCMFDNLERAQEWCRMEITNQAQRSSVEKAVREWAVEPDAWRWLWETLSSELGEARTAEIRTELSHRLRQDEQTAVPSDECDS